MRGFRSKLSLRRGRFWLTLGLAGLLVGGAWLAGRQMWAWYHWRAARLAIERFAGDDARQHLGCCLAVWPNSTATHVQATRAARLAGDLEEAEKHLSLSQRLEKTDSPEQMLEAALIRAETGDLDAVEPYLEARREADPAEAPFICAALAQGYSRMYRIRDALSCLNGWLQRHPDEIEALFLRAEVLRKVRALAPAADDYRRVVELAAERHDARRWLTFCLLEIGQLDEALRHVELVRRHWPDDPEVLVLLARCQSKQGQFGPARQTLDGVLATHPTNSLALRSRGQLALLEEDWADAETWLRRALEVQPNDYEAHAGLHLALKRQGQAAAARAQLDQAEDLKTRLERLTEISTRDMSARPHDPALHCELGRLLLGLGYPALGRSWLLSALHQDPQFAPAQAALAALDQASSAEGELRHEDQRNRPGRNEE
jgi:tetratricopeptide (TPR) repeat protein